MNVMQTLKSWQCKNLVNSVNEDKKELCKKVQSEWPQSIKARPRHTSRTALSGALYITRRPVCARQKRLASTFRVGVRK